MKFDFLLALRYLTKNKALGFINAIGLSIGISACLVIYLIASFELSFDKFQPNRDRIYRVYTQYISKDVVKDYPGIYSDALNTVRDQVAGIESSSHIHSWWAKAEIKDGSTMSRVFDTGNNFVFADSSFFNVFSIYRWLHGNPESSLRDPYKVVLTESRAKIYFGDLPLDQVVGKEIIYRDSIRMSVSGIVADIKENTDFTFTDFISYSTGQRLGKTAPFAFVNTLALDNDSRLFIKIAPGITPEKITSQFPKHTDEFSFELKLQPLSALHFDTNLSIFAFTTRVPVKKSTIEILIALAVALLLIAVINFINIETAQASKRAKEVGVRKVLGSSRWNLIRYFLLESFILTFVSVLLSVALALIAFASFKEFIPPGVSLNLSSPNLILFLLLCLTIIPLLAGLYPSVVLSSHQPARALKDRSQRNGRFSQSSLVRKALTIFQLFFSQGLIIVTLVVGLQIRYMIGKDLGFQTEAIATFHAPASSSLEKRMVLKNRLAQITNIESVSLQSQPPSGADGSNSLLFVFESDKETLEDWVNVKYGDSDYVNLYDIKLIGGSNFVQGDSAHGYIINEAYMNKIGITNPRDIIGKSVNEKPIIGVVKNFHTESLHAIIQPTAIVFDANKLHSVGLKINLSDANPGKLSETMDKVESTWKDVYPDNKFEFSFLDDRIRNYYEAELRVNKLASAATIIAILISSLGLFALCSFTALERTKEIGIRKVLGASVGRILLLLSSEFLILVLIAFIISAPVAYYVSDKWLTGFAFRMNLGAWIFLTSGILSAMLALATISFRTLKAAKTDPVKSLRYE